MADDLPDAPWASEPAALPDAPWVQPEPPPSSRGYMSRLAAGFVPDTKEFFKEGVQQTFDAPGNLLGLSKPTGHEDLGEAMYNKMISIGASPEDARRESDRMLRKLQRGEGIWGPIFGPLTAVTAPLLGLFRSGVSRPVEEKTGMPKEATEGLTMAALAGLGMLPRGAPRVARMRVSENGEVSAQAIGDMPTAADFKSSAEVLGGKHTEANLRRAWEEEGVHPAEAVHDAQTDTFTKHNVMAEQKPAELDADLFDTLKETGGMPAHGLGADVTTTPPIDTPISPTAPMPRPARLMTAAHDALDKAFDIGRNAQMLVAPMARGTVESMAILKDFANALRRNRWEWSRADDALVKEFGVEQRKAMWDRGDEESVIRQEGKTSEHMGLSTLEPRERAVVEDLQTRAQLAWARARDLGMVESEGLPAYTPRMVINTASALAEDQQLPLNGIGYNLKVRTAQMMHRKYLLAEETEAAAKARFGEQAEIARDIRALPLATARLEDAIAGRKMINEIKAAGQRAGTETVSEGVDPSTPEQKWFTVAHPAFSKWRPKFDDGKVVKDADGNTIFERVPLYVRGDFEGPIRATLTEKNGALYSAAMALKGKTMSIIMNSPLIHNAVEWGRAMPAMPGKVATFRVYFEGNRARNDVTTMGEAIDHGMVPIGHRFFNQDITSIMEEPNLRPGRSWTAKVLGAVPGLFDEGAGTAVRAAIDKAGDFWHNTLLWDRVADLQAGLYVNFRDAAIAKGVDRGTAAYMAAHWANRYAGALPQEAMSNAARKISNMLLFSRSFTMGNLGALKDMFTGLPKDVLAQIERDAGFPEGGIMRAETPEGASAVEAVKYAKSMARRKAMAIVALDIGLMYVGNSLLQNAMNVLFMDSTLDKELHGYAARFMEALQERNEHPLKLLQPLDFIEHVSATGENEPGKQDRIKVGYAADGTAIYARNPVGKIADEFLGFMTGPLDMMRKKMGTIARPGWQILSNDAGFGRKIYDPQADTPAKYLANVGAIAAHFFKSQFPEGQISAGADLVKGEGDAKVNALQAFGPFGGVTFAKGAPGGPAVGELYHARASHDFAVQKALPDIRRQIQRGDIAGAQETMSALGIAPGLQKYYIRTSINPATRLGGRTLRDFYQYGTEEQRLRLERAQ